MPDAEQNELLLAFVEEGNELLDESEPLLIELESKANDSGEVDYEVLNTVFRLFHSLKGGAGFLGLDTVESITHLAETLLSLFRKGKGQIRSQDIDLLTKTCDFLRVLLENIAVEFSDDGFQVKSGELKKALGERIAEITEKTSGEKLAPKPEITSSPPIRPVDKPIAPENEVSVNEEKQGGIAQVESQPEDVYDQMILEITPEMIKQFIVESEDLLAHTEHSFLILDKNPEKEEHLGEALRAIHSFKGNAGFLGYRDLEQLSHQAETVLSSVMSHEIIGNSDLFSLLLDVLDFLRNGVNLLAEGKDPVIPAVSGVIHLLSDTIEKAEKPPKQSQADDSSTESDVFTKNEHRPQTGSKSIQADTSEENPGLNRKNSLRQSIRVDIEKLEVLLDLVGELVIAEAMVIQNPDLKTIKTSMENFERATLHLNKITRDLQDIATSIRMIPLAGTFRRMIRLVRDLSQKTAKKVELKIIGEETEVDKTVIEQITDPLVHIIRNSIDHGIATPDERKKYGKSETGALTLEAKHVGGEVWISIRDDGQGLNRAVILRKAIEKGLIDGDGSDMSDEEIWQLVFLPDFSTAKEVTDVSGRGVGMDVVKRNIENIRGTVEIDSQLESGTEVILRIPLTLAIIDGMIVQIGKSRYIVPITSIKETLRLDYADITKTMDGQEILNVRGRLLQIVRLHEFYNIEPTHTELQEGIIMIVETNGRQACLFVDDLIGQQQIVIKGLSEYVSSTTAISGCTILGDGEISLIVDVSGIIEIVVEGKPTQATAQSAFIE